MGSMPATGGSTELGQRSDAELVAGSTDPAAGWAVLFDRHAAALHRYLARRVGPVIAEDLVAQTFLVAFERRGRYDPSYTHAQGWLYGIATNLLRRYHRDEARQLRMLARTGTDPVTTACHSDGVAGRVDAAVLSRRVAGLVAELPTGERDVLLLYAWAGLGLEEIGRALEVPAGTVRSRLYRARKRLRPALGTSDCVDQGWGQPSEGSANHG